MRVKFKLKNNINFRSFIRKAGYYQQASRIILNNVEEINCVRRLSVDNYPHFHLFIKKINQNEIILSLHLDQKKPSYSGASAHSGEYDSPLVQAEMKRIISILSDLSLS